MTGGAGQLTEVTGGQRRVTGAGIIRAGARQLKDSKDCGIFVYLLLKYRGP